MVNKQRVERLRRSSTASPGSNGFRALGAPGGLSALPNRMYARIALALGLPADAYGRALVRTLADRARA